MNKETHKKIPEANILVVEYMALVQVLLSLLTAFFVTTLYIYHIKFTCLNLTTYANVKMAEIIYMFGNPFTRYIIFIHTHRKSHKKNCYLILCKKYYKRVDFLQIVSTNFNSMLMDGLHQRDTGMISHVKIISYKNSSLIKKSKVYAIDNEISNINNNRASNENEIEATPLAINRIIALKTDNNIIKINMNNFDDESSFSGEKLHIGNDTPQSNEITSKISRTSRLQLKVSIKNTPSTNKKSIKIHYKTNNATGESL